MIRAELAIFARAQAKLDFAALQGFCKSATQPQIDSLCASSGLSAGCSVCDSFK